MEQWRCRAAQAQRVVLNLLLLPVVQAVLVLPLTAVARAALYHHITLGLLVMVLQVVVRSVVEAAQVAQV